jgi:hypothetical protein
MLVVYLILAPGKSSTQCSFDAKDVEIGRGDESGPERLGLAAAGVADGGAGLGGHRFE